MRVAIFSNHKYDQNSFEEANGSFRHELVFFTGTLDSATASLASGFPAVCAFVNDRLDAPVLAQLAKGGTKLWPCAAPDTTMSISGRPRPTGSPSCVFPPTRRVRSPNLPSASRSLSIARSAALVTRPPGRFQRSFWRGSSPPRSRRQHCSYPPRHAFVL